MQNFLQRLHKCQVAGIQSFSLSGYKQELLKAPTFECLQAGNSAQVLLGLVFIL
jgi:hypothetical protein